MPHYYIVIPVCCAMIAASAGICYQKFIPASVRILAIEAVISIISDFLSTQNSTYTNVIFNCFLLTDTFLLIGASSSLQSSPVKLKVKWVLLITFVLVWLASVYVNGLNTFANFAFAVSALCVTADYLYTVFLTETGDKRELVSPVRMLSFALILYHCGTFTFFIALPYFMNENTPDYIIDINTWLDSIKYLMIAFSFYLFKRSGKSNPTLSHG